MSVFLLVWTVSNVPHNISIGFKCELWQEHSITRSLFVYKAFLRGISNVLRINNQLKGPLLTQDSKHQAIPKDNISIFCFFCLFFFIWKCFLFVCITFICRCPKTFEYMTVVGAELSNTPIFCSGGNLFFYLSLIVFNASSQKVVSPVFWFCSFFFTCHGCLTFTVLNGVCVQFDTEVLFIFIYWKRKVSHLHSEVKTCTCDVQTWNLQCTCIKIGFSKAGRILCVTGKAEFEHLNIHRFYIFEDTYWR